ASAHISEVAPKAATPATKTRRRPKMSPSEPPISRNDPRVRREASTAHCCVDRPAFRSSAIAGSATLTTVPSRNAIPDPRMHTTRTSVLLGTASRLAPVVSEETPLYCMVEIPKGSRNKYEWDEGLNAIRFDRFLCSSVVYPLDYGR